MHLLVNKYYSIYIKWRYTLRNKRVIWKSFLYTFYFHILLSCCVYPLSSSLTFSLQSAFCNVSSAWDMLHFLWHVTCSCPHVSKSNLITLHTIFSILIPRSPLSTSNIHFSFSYSLSSLCSSFSRIVCLVLRFVIITFVSVFLSVIITLCSSCFILFLCFSSFRKR
jgi:hypothetical protein